MQCQILRIFHEKTPTYCWMLSSSYSLFPVESNPKEGCSSCSSHSRRYKHSFQAVPQCPSNWSLTVWVKATEVQVEDIKTVSQSEAVYCTRFIGNNDSERTPETGVMVEVKTADIIAKHPLGEKNLTSEEAEAMVAEVEKLQLTNEAEAEAVLQRLQEVGYEASLGHAG